MQLQVVAMVVGALAEAAAWWVVSSRGGSVWRVMPPVLIVLGALAWIVRPPVLASGVGTGTAALAGVLFGVLLFSATRVFVAIVSRWDRFARSVDAIYGPSGDIRLLGALALTAAMAAAEELFWRGLFQARLSAGLGAATAAILTWACYLAANLPSASLPIIAGAIVGGAVWAGLAWWSGGLLASLLCHVIWTVSMVALPPKHGTRATALIPPEAGGVFDRGRMCWLAAVTKRGPHCTPVVFARSGEQLWVTTARDSVKARAWRADPTVAGLVRDGDRSTMFSGRVSLYDALDPGTWARSFAAAPSLGRATMGFVTRNARFFAGYAVDARRVPLAWTPPGRVFAVDRRRTDGDRGRSGRGVGDLGALGRTCGIAHELPCEQIGTPCVRGAAGRRRPRARELGRVCACDRGRSRRRCHRGTMERAARTVRVGAERGVRAHRMRGRVPRHHRDRSSVRVARPGYGGRHVHRECFVL